MWEYLEQNLKRMCKLLIDRWHDLIKHNVNDSWGIREGHNEMKRNKEQQYEEG